MANTLGTVDILENERTDDQPPVYHSHLKYDRSGSVPILLVPQPSDDPNDPLVCPRTVENNQPSPANGDAVELAVMETRLDPLRSFSRGRFLRDNQLRHGSQYRDSFAVL
jgi:hypothetical protein